MGSIASYFPEAKSIYLTKVTSITGDNITFEVMDTLRGKSMTVLTLKLAAQVENFPIKSEWLLVSCPSGPGNGSVGWPIVGNNDWLPGEIFRQGKDLYLRGGTWPQDGITLDKLPDGSSGLTLDHLKQLLKKQSSKS